MMKLFEKAFKFINRGQYCLKKRNYVDNSQTDSLSTVNTAADSMLTKNISGLSKKVLDVPSGKVGPGASKEAEYKNSEYYCYNNISYFEAEVEMLKYRLPQPSNRTAKV